MAAQQQPAATVVAATAHDDARPSGGALEYVDAQAGAASPPRDVDFGMSLPAALAAPRVSQRNAPTSLAEPDFYNSAVFGGEVVLARDLDRIPVPARRAALTAD